MANNASAQQQPVSPGRPVLKRMVQVVTIQLVFAAVLLIAAGRLDWVFAWAYLALSLGILSTMGLWVALRYPDVVGERARTPEYAKRWDRVLMSVYALLNPVTLIVIGLDAGRFEWSGAPLTWKVVGLASLVPVSGLIYWAMAANAYLATTVRIQEERGHRVATRGPYRFVRHPMYLGMILSWLCTTLGLGSLWGLIPGGLMAITLILRTALEDRTLHEELAGYTEYAQHVRYRLLPGVW